jgi:hypothetical protein
MNREQFLEYVDHFNNKRYDAVTSYFTPDITVEYSSVWADRTLHGPQEFIDSYKSLHETVREFHGMRRSPLCRIVYRVSLLQRQSGAYGSCFEKGRSEHYDQLGAV